MSNAGVDTGTGMLYKIPRRMLTLPKEEANAQ
jgi:hypothetical protein